MVKPILSPVQGRARLSGTSEPSMVSTKRETTTSHDPQGATDPPGGQKSLMKWVGGVTAVLSLFAGLYQVIQLVADARERERQVAEFSRTAKRRRLCCSARLRRSMGSAVSRRRQPRLIAPRVEYEAAHLMQIADNKGAKPADFVGRFEKIGHHDRHHAGRRC